MIIVQTPLRISLAGGGTDFREYFGHSGGSVVSSAIDKYLYVIVKERFDRKIRIGYSRTEMVDTTDEIEHELVREAMRKVDVTHGIEIATMADIPSEGSGLGSSSAVTVGLLHALYTYKGQLVTPGQLAREACEIEIDVLGKPIGKQDQYIAAYGGLRRIDFRPDDTVSVTWVPLSEERRRRLGESLLLFYTGVTRRAETILAEQRSNIAARRATLDALRQQVDTVWRTLTEGDTRPLGEVLDAGWRLKQELADGISTPDIEAHYQAALSAGALGGKVAGAGGGGFLLLHCPPERHAALRQALAGLKELPFALERDGTKVVLNVRR